VINYLVPDLPIPVYSLDWEIIRAQPELCIHSIPRLVRPTQITYVYEILQPPVNVKQEATNRLLSAFLQ
jgi:hypothetical protein